VPFLLVFVAYDCPEMAENSLSIARKYGYPVVSKTIRD